ncbi:MAG: repeat-associated core domain protein, partial [Mucilaginibacter sp.]|nr:repeat-associated core domain protein [Mucilaginibacter sp.]
SEVQTGANAPAYYLQYDVTGKVTAIYRDAALTQLVESFSYDELGNRIKTINMINNNTTYYLYDANHNILAIYTGPVGGSSTITEVPVYGSGRMGSYTFNNNNYVYELRDNVGSVRALVNRNKNNSGQADIMQYNDYFPYGSVARNGGPGYRYDYQGAYAEKDPTTGLNIFQLRMYDGRIGRWLSTDPENIGDTPYNGMSNNPSTVSDPNGGCPDDDPSCACIVPVPPTVTSTPTGYLMSEVTIEDTRTHNNANRPNYSLNSLTNLMFGGTHTIQNGFLHEFNTHRFGDKYSIKYWTKSTTKGHSGLLNANGNAFADQKGITTLSGDLSFNGGPVTLKLTSNFGGDIEVGVEDLFGVHVGISADDGLTLGGHLGHSGGEISARPGLGTLGAAAAVFVGITQPEISVPTILSKLMPALRL